MLAYLAIEGIMILTIIYCFIRSSKSGFLDVSNTSTLRGIAIIGIVMHHLAQYTNLYNKGTALFLLTAYLFAGLFFFASGYGNLLSYSKVKDAALKTRVSWLTKRVLRIVLSYIIVFIVSYLILLFSNPDMVTVKKVTGTLLEFKMPGWMNWYVKIQLMLYIMFFVIYSIKCHKIIKYILFVGLNIFIIYSFIKQGVYPYWWNSLSCFIIGVIIAENKALFVKILDKYKYIILFLSLIAFAVCFEYNRRSIDLYGIAACILFLFIVLSINFIRPFHNKVLSYLGNISLEIYFVHLVFVRLFLVDCKIGSKSLVIILIFILSFICAALLSKAVTLLQDKLMKKL